MVAAGEIMWGKVRQQEMKKHIYWQTEHLLEKTFIREKLGNTFELLKSKSASSSNNIIYE